MKLYRVIKVGLGLTQDMDSKLVEQHIPIAAFQTKEEALKFMEEYEEPYMGYGRNTRVMYYEGVEVKGRGKDNIIKELSLGKPLEGRYLDAQSNQPES